MVKREWSRAGFGCALVLLYAACGGESRRTEPNADAPNGVPMPAPSDGVPNTSPSAIPTATASTCSSSAAPTPLPTATSTDPSPPPAMPCPTNEIYFELDMNVGAITTASDGTTVETLQVPDYPAPDYTQPVPQPNSDPANWDRSELPAGACVFRLYGLHAACFPTGGDIKQLVTDSSNSGSPDAGPPQVLVVGSMSYYDMQGCSVEPGCPSADPRDSLGWWWYVADRGDAMDVVVCAPECANDFVPYTGVQVTLNPWGKCQR